MTWPILVLQVNFAGAIEVDKQRIYFFAALFDSHVLFITIDGSMGLLVAYGDDANFVVSVGGFHPQFAPAAPAVPDAAADLDQSDQRVVRAHPRRRLLRRHQQHRPIRHARGLLLRVLGAESCRAPRASTR